MDVAIKAAPDLPDAEFEHRFRAFQEAPKSNDRQAGELGEALLRDFPEASRIRGRLARLKQAQGDHAGALELALAELARSPGRPKLLKLAASATETVHGLEASLLLLEALADSGEDDGWANLRLADYAMHIEDGREALRRFDLAEQAGRIAPNITLHRCRAARIAQDVPLARRYFNQLPAEQQAMVRRELEFLEDRLKSAGKLRRSGRLHALTSNQLKAWGAARGAAPFDQGESGLFVSESGDMLGERVEGCRSALLVFGGLRELVGAALPKFDEVLRAERINTLYLSDPRRLLLLSGLETFGDYRQSLDGLRSLLDRWGVEEVFCFGVSAGGYPAVAYGVELGARRILTLAGPTTLVGPVMELDRRARILKDRTVAAVKDRDLDLRNMLLAASNPPEIISYYAEDSPEDVAHAEHLRGLANVRLKALSGEIGHGVAGYLDSIGEYPKVIAELLAGRLPPSA